MACLFFNLFYPVNTEFCFFFDIAERLFRDHAFFLPCFAGGDLNIYRYATNNPVKFRDLLGTYWFDLEFPWDLTLRDRGKKGVESPV